MTERLSEKIFKISIHGTAAQAYGAVGTVYNSYLIMSDENVLIDTVPLELADAFITELEALVPISDIDRIICTHTEPESSGALFALLAQNSNIKITASAAGLRNIKELLNAPVSEFLIKNGAVLDCGVRLEYIITPNLHWPDTVCVYAPEENMLFSGGLFGTYDDGSAEKYYTGRFAPFGDYMKSAVSELKKRDIKVICPSHGAVCGTDIIVLYDSLCTGKYKEGKTAAVFYASYYGFTRTLAELAAQTLNEHGIKSETADVEKVPQSKIAELLKDSDAVLFGSPTINRNAVKAIWDTISAAEIVKSGKPAFVFGSYGWSGEAVSIMEAALRSMRFKLPVKACRCILNPSPAETEEFRAGVEKFAEYLNS